MYPVVGGLAKKKSKRALVVFLACFFIKVKFVAKGFLSLQISFSCSSVILLLTKSLL